MLKLTDVLELPTSDWPPTCWGECPVCAFETELTKKDDPRLDNIKSPVYLCGFCASNHAPHPNWVANALIDALAHGSPIKREPHQEAFFLMGFIDAKNEFKILSTPQDGIVIVPAKFQLQLMEMGKEHNAMYRILDHGTRLRRLTVAEDPSIPTPPEDVTLEGDLLKKVTARLAMLAGEDA